MKTIFLSLFFLLIAQSMYSQDYEPSQRKFVWNGIPRYLNADMDYFKQKDFQIGWHWGFPHSSYFTTSSMKYQLYLLS